MFKVVVYVEWFKTDAVYIKRWNKELRLGFDAEMEIQLPFVPYPGLIIEIPERGEEPDYYRLTLNSVVWEHQNQRFFVACKEKSECKTFDEMDRAAKSYESDGFTVSRENMCAGEW